MIEIEYRSREKTPEFALMQFCKVCSGHFFVREHDEGKIATCCKRCDRKLSRERIIEERTHAVTKVSAHIPLTPYESSRLRSHIFQCVAEQIEVAHAFVMNRPLDPSAPEGEPGSAPPKLNPQQVRVFTALLNKVVPDLSHTFTQNADKPPDLRELTREELERIVSEAKIISPAPAPEPAHPITDPIFDPSTDFTP